MIDVHYVQCMARYNRWQNENLYGAADALSDAERRRDRGAFFGSIHATLNHLLWADRIWMSRLAGTPHPAGGIPESVALHSDWDELKRERKAFDAVVSTGPTGSTPRHSQATSSITPARSSGKCTSRHGFWSRICSTIRRIIAARCIAC